MEERKHPSKRRIAVSSLIVAGAIVVGMIVLTARQKHLETLEKTQQVAVEIIAETERSFESIEPLSPAEKSSLRTFRNEQHVAAAEQYGISGITSREQAAELMRARELVRIESNPLYRVRDLQYSIPYLTPSAANLLDRISHRFHRRLGEEGLPPYRLVVTSVTRSREDQEALRQVNVNAAERSSHEFGTTFDLHYAEFNYEARPVVPEREDLYPSALRERVSEAYDDLAATHTEALKAISGEVLLELQSESDAMVIYERRQPVYHVTVANEIPEAPPRLQSESQTGSDLVSMSRK